MKKKVIESIYKTLLISLRKYGSEPRPYIIFGFDGSKIGYMRGRPASVIKYAMKLEGFLGDKDFGTITTK